MVGPLCFTIRPPGGGEPRAMAVDGDGRWAEPGPGVETVASSAGWWAVGGLVDAHAHLASNPMRFDPGEPAGIRRRAFACLDRGTFLVIDKGWSDDTVLVTLSGAPPDRAPDLVGAGRIITVPGGYYPDFAEETDPAGLGEAVARGAAAGAGWVKLIGDWPRKGRGAVANFDEATLATAVEVARAGGARVAIHTMAPEVASMAVRAGVDSIEHGLFLTMDDLVVLGERAGAWVPTVLRMEAVMHQLGLESSGGRLLRQGLDNVANLLSGGVPEGVAVLAGTDLALEVGDVGPEVEALVGCGLAPERALAAASDEARRYLGRPGGFGVGQPADAVFFEADPLVDAAVLRRPVAVLRHGILRG